MSKNIAAFIMLYEKITEATKIQTTEINKLRYVYNKFMKAEHDAKIRRRKNKK